MKISRYTYIYTYCNRLLFTNIKYGQECFYYKNKHHLEIQNVVYVKNQEIINYIKSIMKYNMYVRVNIICFITEYIP